MDDEAKKELKKFADIQKGAARFVNIIKKVQKGPRLPKEIRKRFMK